MRVVPCVTIPLIASKPPSVMEIGGTNSIISREQKPVRTAIIIEITNDRKTYFRDKSRINEAVEEVIDRKNAITIVRFVRIKELVKLLICGSELSKVSGGPAYCNQASNRAPPPINIPITAVVTAIGFLFNSFNIFLLIGML